MRGMVVVAPRREYRKSKALARARTLGRVLKLIFSTMGKVQTTSDASMEVQLVEMLPTSLFLLCVPCFEETGLESSSEGVCYTITQCDTVK